MHYMFLPLRRYFDFQGRSRRLEFWLFMLFNVVVQTILGIVFMAMLGGKLFDLVQRYATPTGGSSSTSVGGLDVSYSWDVNIPFDVLVRELGTPFTVMMAIYAIYSAIVFFPYLAVAVRRLHDTNRSGWWLLIPTLIYCLCILLVCAAIFVPAMAWLFGLLGVLVGLAAGLSGLVLFVLMLLDGTPGYNQFGPDPKGRDIRPTFG